MTPLELRLAIVAACVLCGQIGWAAARWTDRPEPEDLRVFDGDFAGWDLVRYDADGLPIAAVRYGELVPVQPVSTARPVQR